MCVCVFCLADAILLFLFWRQHDGFTLCCGRDVCFFFLCAVGRGLAAGVLRVASDVRGGLGGSPSVETCCVSDMVVGLKQNEVLQHFPPKQTTFVFLQTPLRHYVLFFETREGVRPTCSTRLSKTMSHKETPVPWCLFAPNPW